MMRQPLCCIEEPRRPGEAMPQQLVFRLPLEALMRFANGRPIA